MGNGKINVWIREPDDCTVNPLNGYAWAQPCCIKNGEAFYSAKLEKGHATLEVPPGCYIVDAAWKPGCCGTAKETMGIVNCEQTVCVNLLREYAGDVSVKRIASIMNHAREANIPEAKIKEMKDILVKISDAEPRGKIRMLSENELRLKREISDAPHKKILDELAPLLKKK